MQAFLGPGREGAAVTAPELLRPVAPDVPEHHGDRPLPRVAGAASGGCTSTDYAELHHWSVDDLEGFWSAVAEYFGVRCAHPALRACSAAGRCRVREWFPGATLNYAEHALGSAGDADEVAVLGLLPDPGPGRADLGRAARAGRPGPRRPAAARRRPGRPGGRPTCRTSPRRWSRSSPPRAWARSGRAARRSSARAAWSTGSARSSRRSCSRSPGTATATKDVDRREQVAEIRAGAADREPRRARALRRGRLPDALDWDELLGASRATSRSSRCRSTTRCACCSPPAPPGKPKAIVHGHGGILLEHLKNHGAELGPRAGRPDAVVLHHRLDDVERAGVGAAGAARRSC